MANTSETPKILCNLNGCCRLLLIDQVCRALAMAHLKWILKIDWYRYDIHGMYDAVYPFREVDKPTRRFARHLHLQGIRGLDIDSLRRLERRRSMEPNLFHVRKSRWVTKVYTKLPEELVPIELLI
ncbi:MAG: hypothetical protein NTU53_11975 [Planctomycetota bacterium]|nr:hypothetical protein [Planctomycetota bacterium]